MSNLAYARRYRTLGYHPVPVLAGTKRPSVNWKPYQATAPTDDEITAWWTTDPKAGIALVMGRETFAVDLDGGDVAERLLADAGVTLPPDAPRSRTGGGGYHVLLSGTVPDAVALVKDESREHCQVDIRGKGIIIVPPSIHPSGTPYKWDVFPTPTSDLPDAPAELLALMSSPIAPVVQETTTIATDASWVATALAGVGQGKRADTCARLAGYFLGRGLARDIVSALLQEGFAKACTPPMPAPEVAATVKSIASREAVSGDSPDIPEPVHISAVLDELERQRKEGAQPSVPLGIDDVEYFLGGGFHRGELIYLGARPGVGKTALALQIATKAASHGHPVVIVSREMVNTALARRMLSQSSGVPSRELKGGTLGRAHQLDYDAAFNRTRQYPMWLTDQIVGISELCAMLERATYLTATSGKVGLLIVDYLQLVRPPSDVKDRRLQVEAVSQTLKTVALQYKMPVLCLSSLSRPPQATPDAKPTLASLRESGELEHDADVVMFLHRKFSEQQTTLIVAKNREGQTGDIEMTFNAETLTLMAVQKGGS